MSNFKILSLLNLFLLCFSLTVYADDANKPTVQTDNEKQPVLIKFKPDYKKTSLESSADLDTYKRAINIEVDKNIKKESMSKIADERCRAYNLKQREKYFISFVNNKNGKIIKNIDCADIEGPIIEIKKDPENLIQ